MGDGHVVLPISAIKHACSAHARKRKFVDLRVRHNCEIRAPPGRLKICQISGTALTVADRHMHGAETLLPVTVVVLGATVARLFSRRDKRGVERVFHIVAVTSIDWALAAPVDIGSTHPALGALEIRQAIGVTPSGSTGIFPLLKILRMPPHIHHTVYRRRAAQYPAASAIHPAAV